MNVFELAHTIPQQMLLCFIYRNNIITFVAELCVPIQFRKNIHIPNVL